MLLSFQTALILNNKQVSAFRKASGTARHAYNWANAAILEVLKLRETDKSV
ncbi:helix-turn-helix domain-containing protein, partial [Anabaena sp. CS-542/02]|uniref:helix-turn-helix domain-containing protein n=1 Tax=Anabaena sp. CS-542/02 TaxID=3021719 RepID=UPI00232B2F4E